MTSLDQERPQDSALSRGTVQLLVTVPTVLALIAGFFHPENLTEETAARWWALHLVLLFVFPAMGLAPWLVARQVDRRLGRVAAIGGYGFATCYTALDVLAGIGGGAMVLGGQADATGPLFRVANQLAQAGVYALVFGTIVAAVAALLRAGPIALVGGLPAVVGAYLIARGHIYVPMGTLALTLLALGYAVLAWAVFRTQGARRVPRWNAPKR